ncbi:MAG: 30S ribosomal protein S17 [Chloroflexi bacterium RBG_13_52_12]|nr:MAG: 30S ribosomal protein S17 [Chloroflexi bacterium RBG_13_52_12]
METKRKTRFGKVVSDKMKKTVIVAVDTPRRHPLYKKIIRRVVKYYAHDENSISKMGDTVKIEETRPLSKLKRWRVVEIVTKGEVAEIKPEEITN